MNMKLSTISIALIQIASNILGVNAGRRLSAYTHLSDTFSDEKQDHGTIKVNDGTLFHWMFWNRDGKKDAPVTIWFTGGPGCASELALFKENGPFRLDDEGNIVSNPYSWNKHNVLVFIDQPVGTGFSEATKMCEDEQCVVADMRVWFEKFLEKYPEFVDRRLFLAGESYAGHYIPSIVANQVDEPITGLNLAGMLIGNGMYDISLQYPSYPKFAYDNNKINWLSYHVEDLAMKACSSGLASGSQLAFMAANVINTAIIGPRESFNIYDVRKECIPPLCYDMTDVTAIMNSDTIQKALGVEGEKWEDCSMDVHEAMGNDIFSSMLPNLATILDANIPVLLYFGDQDYICNWYGGEAVAKAVPWTHKKDFNAAVAGEWGEEDGKLTTYGNFQFLQLFDAGHLVPMDQPKAALKMLKDFQAGKLLAKMPTQRKSDNVILDKKENVKRLKIMRE